jgi:hypothetical protein
VDAGDVVRYRVVPVIAGSPVVRVDLASAWSDARLIGDPPDAVHVARFNRGFVISQFVSRYLDAHYPGLSRDAALKQFKDDLGDTPIGSAAESTMRGLLSGQVRTTMLDLLRQTEDSDGHLFAAIFELDDEELVSGLAQLGPNAHVVLANGSIKKKKTETTTQARAHDENAAARATLIAARVDVEETNRFVSPGALAHDKFAVVTDKTRMRCLFGLGARTGRRRGCALSSTTVC